MKRWISILLCMTMLFTSVLGDISWALAETEEDALIQEVVSGNEEAEVGLATDAGDTGLTIEYEEEPGDSSDDYIIEIIEDETTEDSGSAADGDDGKTLSALSGFDFGYAKIISGADVYAESGAEAIALAKIGKGDVVLCIGRADKRAKITFNTEKGVVTGYVDDSILVKMSDDEINSFMNEAADYANVVLYENNLDYPISYLNCTFVDNSAQKQAGEQTEVSSGENEETADSEEAAKKDSVNTPSENENNIPADGETTETPTEDGAIEGETTETPTEGGATDGETTETPTEDGAIEGETTETPTEGDKIDGETTETPTEGEVIEGETTETPSEGGTTEGETTETPTEGEVTESETTETPSEGGATEGETTETPSEGKVTEGETTETPSEGGATEGETTETPTEGEETEGETTETPTEGEVTEGETTETPSEGEVTEGETTETPSEGEVTDGETTETPTEGDVTEGETTETPSEGGATEGETTETPTEGEETEGETTETPTEGDVIDGENADTSAEEGVEEETTEDTSNEEGSEELEVAEGLEEGIVEDMPVAMFSLRSPLALNETAVPVLTSLSRSAVSMAVGENFTLKAFDAEGNEIDEVVYALSSENTEEAILTLYGNEVVAEAVGTEIITATYNEISLTCEVSVFDAPQSIIVDKTDLKLHEGMKEKLNVSFDSENTASLIQFAYSGETEGVVSVDAQGNISALKAGSCKIIVSASTEGIAPVEVSITVYPGPTGIILSASEMTLGAGETAKLDIDTIDGIGKDDIFVFESSNSDAAAVDQNGMIEARAKGEATITVTASNGVYAQCKVNVLNAPTRIAFASDLAIGVGQNKAIPEMTLYAGETETSTGAIREIVSGNSEFVIVESDGTLTGVNVGTATVTVTAYNGATGSFKVTVMNPPSSIALEPAEAELSAGGQQLQLKPIFNSGSMGAVVYESSDIDVATVDENGLVTTWGYGYATITATVMGNLGEELKATSLIEVSNAPAQVMLSKKEVQLGVNFSEVLSASALDAQGVQVNAGYTYHIEQEGNIIAFDEATGKITGLGIGTAKIYVQTHNGVSQYKDEETGEMVDAVCSVEVRGTPKTLSLNISGGNIGYGETYTGLKATAYDENGKETKANLSVWSSKSSYVKAWYDAASGQIRIQGRKAGKSAYVYVRTHNGLQKAIKVNVKKAPSKCYVSPGSVTLAAEGQTCQLKVSVNSGTACATYAFASSNPNVVTVSGGGLLTAVNSGSATITIRTYNNRYAYCKVNVIAPPAEVYFPTEKMTIGVSQSSSVKAAVRAEDGSATQASYTFHTEDTDIISLNASTGAIKGLAKGEATITVKTHNGVYGYTAEDGEPVVATCTVKVVAAPAAVQLNLSGTKYIGLKEYFSGLKINLLGPVGEDGEREETAGTYSVAITKGSKYISINQSGHIYGKKTGSAQIRVSSYNGKHAYLNIKVVKAPKKVAMNASNVTLALGGSAEDGTIMTYQLGARVNSGAASGTFTFGYYNEAAKSVFEITPSGLITPKSVGTGYAVVRTYNGKAATCKVTVKPEPATVQLSAETLKLGVGQGATLKATAYDASGAATVAKFRFESSKPDTVYINPTTGAISAKAKTEEAIITVTAHNGAYGYEKDGVFVATQCRVKVVAAPAAVQLNLSGTKTIGLKEYFSGLKITMLGPVGEDGEREETAGNYSVAITKGSKYISINQSGHVYGKKTGSAQIRVSSYNGKHAYLNIKVVKAPSKVALNTSNITLALGGSAEDGTIMTYQLSARVNGGAASGAFTFGYYNEAAKSVFEITPSGLITPKSVGTGYAVVRTYNGKAATCKVTVKPEPATVQLSAETLKLGVGQGATLKATAYDASGAATVAKFRFESSNPDAVYINPTTGAISAKAKTEEAIITVTAHNGAYGYEKDGAFVAAQCRVKVVAAPAAVQLNLSGTKTIGLKEYFSGLKITMLGPVGEDGEREETAGNYSVAITKGSKYISINQSGHIYGKKTGSAQIRVSSYNGKHAYLNIKVVKAPSKIALNASAVTLALGKYEGTDNPMTYQLGAWVNGGAASGGYTFTSNNTSVATVSGGGLITPVSAGTATITVSTYNNKRAYCKVTVLDEPAEVFLPETITTAEGLSGNISASVKDALGGNTTTKYTYSVVNGTDAEGKGSLTINPSTGAITGKVAGEAEIRVKAHNGVSTHLVDGSPVETVCKVKIVPAPKDLKLNTYGVTIGVGEKITIKGTMLAPDGTELTGSNLTFSRNNTRITVNGSGVVQGKKTGTAYVYVRTYNGITKTVKVVVKKAPKKVSITPGSATLGVGQTGQFRAKFASGYYGGHSFTSSNPNVATINAAGVVTAKAVGSTTITVRTYNGKAKSAKLTVRKGPEFMLLSGTGLNRVDVGDLVENEIIGQAGVFTGHLYEKLMKPGETFQIGVTNEKFTNGNVVSYESSDAAVASVNGSGKITALKNGVALIAVTSSSGAEEYILVTVDDPTVQLEFADESAEILVGEVKPVPALKGVDDPLYQMTLEYTGNLNLNVFMDDETGKWYMEGVSVGSGMLGVKTPHANGASIPVTVKAQHNGDVTVSTADEMAIGDTADISVSNVISGDYELESLNKSVAVVENGRLKAVGAGTTNVIATMLDGAEFYSNPVTVSAKPVSVKLDSQTATLKVNETMQLRPDVGEAYTTFSYASDNEAVATVDANGKITAIAPGAARITVNTAVPGIFTYCDITVKAAPGAPDTATLQTGAMLLFAGETGAIEVVFSRADGAECTAAELKYASDSEVVSISNDGVVSAVAAGIANITVSAILNGEEKEIGVCAVTVKETAQKLSVTPESLTLSIADAEGETLTISGLAEGETLTAEADKDIADISVSENIITVIPKAAGSAKLTITASNGNAVVCLLTIEALPVQPTGISVNKPDYKLGVGETFDIGAALIPAGSAGEIAYVSEDESVATVENGVISAVAPGSATIRVSCGEISGSIDVEVGYGVESVRLERDELNLLVGAEYLMTAPELMGESAKASGSYTWAISNPKVATIDAEGKITAKAEGTAILMVTAYNGVKGYMDIIVSAQPSEIRFADESICLAVGESYAPVVLSDAGALVDAVFSVEESVTCLAIEDNKLVGKEAGEAVVTATYGEGENALTAEIAVTVGDVAGKVSLNASEITLSVGEKFQLVAETDGVSATIDYASEDEYTASVNGNGLITARRAGQTIITATAFGGEYARCVVNVVSAPTELSVTPGEITASLAEGGAQLRWSFGSSDEGGKVYFDVTGEDEGANISAISVNEDGYITFNEVGWAYVTVKTHNGLTAVVPVTVTATPGSMNFEAADLVIVKGDTVLNPIVFPGNTSTNFELSDGEGIVSVQKSGASVAFTGLEVGKTTITATTAIGLTATCNVEVVDAVSGMTLSPASLSLYLGEQAKLAVSFEPENAKATVSFISQNELIATVDADGYVTGGAQGSTIIQAQLKIGENILQTASCEVTVTGPRRKMFIAHSYYDTAYGGEALYFSHNNARGMKNTFSKSSINGEEYEMKFMTNPSKNTLLGGLSSYFADSTENDINVIYLLSHGLPTADGYQYGLVLPGYVKYANNSPYYYISATELMATISQIKGKVVLILDSCYSGVFIDNMRSKLNAAGGRISVMTATSNINASYWLEKNVNKDVDFFTFALLQGLGYNCQNNVYGYGLAADSNGNGQVTLQELFNFTKSKTVSYVSSYYKSSKFRGNRYQVPQSYIGDNADLVLFDPK